MYPNTKWERHSIVTTFPKGTALLVDLRSGTVVVEASEKSGSLITAEFALEQGREVFAVPGRITEEGAKGSNLMLSQGAKMVCSVQDVLEEI